ncbi:hypothetical protein [Ornithinimicrobium kibberense]|uniref:hypothetical protein n=1 Tax=Ornithinimicrobium kibberense TaxID=282060 RepID=UPI00361D408D
MLGQVALRGEHEGQGHLGGRGVVHADRVGHLDPVRQVRQGVLEAGRGQHHAPQPGHLVHPPQPGAGDHRQGQHVHVPSPAGHAVAVPRVVDLDLDALDRVEERNEVGGDGGDDRGGHPQPSTPSVVRISSRALAASAWPRISFIT